MTQQPVLEICSNPFERALTLPSSHLITSFSIWGLPPHFPVGEFGFRRRTINHKAQRLFCYPENTDMQDQFARFIDPQGVDSWSTTSFECLLEAPRKYFLVLPGEGSTSFCVCLVRKELLNYPSDFVQETQMTTIYAAQSSQIVTERIYCFVSECPFITALFTMLEELETRDFADKTQWLRMFYIKCDPPRRVQQTTNQALTMLRLKKMMETQLCDLADANLTVDVLGQQQTFSRTMLYTSFPPAERQVACSLQMIGDYALPRLFVGVPVTTILQTLSSLLCETSVIFVGNTISLVTSAVFGMLALLFPFVWQGVLLPFVPVELQEFLEAPVPSLCGTEIPKQVVQVYADVIPLQQGSLFSPSIEKMILKTNVPHKHPLPFTTELHQHLVSLVQHYFGPILKLRTFIEREKELAKVDQQTLIAFSTAVQKAVKELLYDRVLDYARSFCIQHGPLDLQAFITKFPSVIAKPHYRAFMTDFISSQHFNVWWYKNKLMELSKTNTHQALSPSDAVSLGGSHVSSAALSPCRTPEPEPSRNDSPSNCPPSHANASLASHQPRPSPQPIPPTQKPDIHPLPPPPPKKDLKRDAKKQTKPTQKPTEILLELQDNPRQDTSNDLLKFDDDTPITLKRVSVSNTPQHNALVIDPLL